MIADSRSTGTETVGEMWNIFFHLFLDEESTAFLETQCKKLLLESTSLDAWNRSGYSFLRFCNDHTRLELRRHWQLYVDAGKTPSKRKREVRETILLEMRKVKTKREIKYSGCRSAGPYFLQSSAPVRVVFDNFWTTGTTLIDEEAPSLTTNSNPTFLHSLVGTTFAVHFGTTPIAPFHLEPAFLRSEPASTVASDLVDCARLQFRDWVTSFQAFLGRQPGIIAIRVFCGDALRFCQALAEYRATGSVSDDQTAAPWNTTPLVFDGPDYVPGSTSAPSTFNVIETSNLVDHVGLFNVLIATVPLLSETHSATLFTETLLCVRDDATKSFNRQLCADLPTTGVLLGLLPTSYSSNFSSRSNAAETMLQEALGPGLHQYHERFVWRRPITSDALASTLDSPPPCRVAFEPLSLAKLLLGIYLHMFSDDNAVSSSGPPPPARELEFPMAPYVRETFVALVAMTKRIVIADWETTLDVFFMLLEKVRSGILYHQDLCAQLHLAGIYTAFAMSKDVAKQGRFRGWRRVPPTVSVTLVVPRANIQVLLDLDRAEITSPVIQATLQGQSGLHNFSSIKLGFGKVKNSGTDSDPRIIFDADPLGWAGSSPLVMSFSVPSGMLHGEDPKDMMIALSFRPSPHTHCLAPKFGPFFRVFAARLMDTSAVFVVPEEPHGMCQRLCNMPKSAGDSDDYRISAIVDTEGERISMLIVRFNILDDLTKAMLSDGAPVTSHQPSPCTIEVNIGPVKRRLVYPSPVVVTLSELRIARGAHYIEVGQYLSPSPDPMSHERCDRSLPPSPETTASTPTHSQSRFLKKSKRLGISIASIWTSSPLYTLQNQYHCATS